MSASSLPAPRWLTLIAIPLSFLLAGQALGQTAPDSDTEFLDQVRRREKVAAQKTEDDLRQALKEAERLSSQPARAVERLDAALSQLQADTSLPEARRKALVAMLKDRIRVTQADAAGPSEKEKNQRPVVARSPDRATARHGQETVPQQGSPGDARKIKEGLKKVQVLQDQAKFGEASREAAELAHQFPENKSAFAADRTASGLDQVATARRILKERERSLLGASRDIDRSAAIVNGDLEFPKDWKERTKGRIAAVQLTDKEKAILKALNTPITVHFSNSKLSDAIKYLETLTDVPILLDHEALKEVEASYDTPISLTMKQVSARTVLRKVLAEIGMTYVIKEETIQATSAERARKMMVVRRYYIGDLITNGGALTQLNPLSALPPTSLQIQGAPVTQTVELLIDMIKNSVDSQSWLGGGGDGTISFHAASMSLIVKQSAEVHARLASSGLGK
jgi:hypothetical protein